MPRHLLSVCFVLAILFASTNLLAAKPAIAATCYGASCNGLDPTMECWSGAYVVARDYYLSRWYSPACNTFWAAASGSYTYTYVDAWMEDNPDATYRSRYSSATSAMWATGRACMYGYGGNFYYSCV